MFCFKKCTETSYFIQNSLSDLFFILCDVISNLNLNLAGNASDSKRFKILFKFYSPAMALGLIAQSVGYFLHYGEWFLSDSNVFQATFGNNC